MNEYELLRSEMLNEYDSIAQYNGVLYTASAAILAFGIERESFLLCLLPYCVILPIHFLCEDKFHMMCKIGAYLHVFCEGSDYHWERRKHRLDFNPQNQKTEIVAWRIHLQYYFILIVCLLLAIIMLLRKDYSIAFKCGGVAVMCAITISAIIIVNINTTNFTQLRESYIQRWTELKREELSEQNRANR